MNPDYDEMILELFYEIEGAANEAQGLPFTKARYEDALQTILESASQIQELLTKLPEHQTKD